MTVTRVALVVLSLLSPSAHTSAQVIEIGAGISRACVGSERSACGEHIGWMWASHGSLWIDDRLEVALRLARMPLPDVRGFVSRDDRFSLADDPAIRAWSRMDVTHSRRSRQLIAGELIYHFARGSSLRGLLGVGVGDLANRGLTSCAPAGCEQLSRILGSPVGRYRATGGNLTAIVGLSGLVTRQIRIRGGIRLHNFWGESLSTAEAFIAAGYRFGQQ